MSLVNCQKGRARQADSQNCCCRRVDCLNFEGDKVDGYNIRTLRVEVGSIKLGCREKALVPRNPKRRCIKVDRAGQRLHCIDA